MHRGILRKRVGDGDLHVVAAVHPECRTEIASIVAERPALSTGKEGRASGLGLERDRLALLAGVDEIGDA